jgi:hypothetical protein
MLLPTYQNKRRHFPEPSQELQITSMNLRVLLLYCWAAGQKSVCICTLLLARSQYAFVLYCWITGQKSVFICTLLLDSWPEVSMHLYFTAGLLARSQYAFVLYCWTAGQKSICFCTLLLDCWPEVSMHLYFTAGLLARSQYASEISSKRPTTSDFVKVSLVE